jgi:hypothetical protein
MNILNEEVVVVANQLIDLGVIVFGGIKSLVEKERRKKREERKERKEKLPVVMFTKAVSAKNKKS